MQTGIFYTRLYALMFPLILVLQTSLSQTTHRRPSLSVAHDSLENTGASSAGAELGKTMIESTTYLNDYHISSAFWVVSRLPRISYVCFDLAE